MGIDRVAQLEGAARIVQQTLTRLGFCSRFADGNIWEVPVCDLVYYTPADVGLLEVDVHKLPRRVKVMDLVRPETLCEISTALGGYRIEARNQRGLVFVIYYTREKKVELPTYAHLELDGRPSGEYLVPIGVGRAGPCWVSLFTLLNTLIGGEPGAGKSMLINAWLVSLTQTYQPSDLTLTLVDPKRVELSGWGNLPHLLSPVATTPEEVLEALDLLLDELDRRARLLQSVNARSLASYNQRAKERLPVHLTVVDELTDLTIAAGGPRSELFTKLIRVASTGRALGVLFLLATQSPRVEIINGNLKACMNTRIAFRTASREDSRVILGRSEAAKISKQTPGRLVASLGDGIEYLQGFHLTDEEIDFYQGSFAGGQVGDVGFLTEDEYRVGRIALSLSGAFNLEEIYRRTGPKGEGGVSMRWLKETARIWERRGWLSSDPSDPTRPRVLTDVLRAILAKQGESLQIPVGTRDPVCRNTSEQAGTMGA